MPILIILVILLVVVVGWFIGLANRLARYRVVIDESKRNVDIALAKRYDTISEMLKVAKSYAKHEQTQMPFLEETGLDRKRSLSDLDYTV